MATLTTFGLSSGSTAGLLTAGLTSFGGVRVLILTVGVPYAAQVLVLTPYTDLLEATTHSDRATASHFADTLIATTTADTVTAEDSLTP